MSRTQQQEVIPNDSMTTPRTWVVVARVALVAQMVVAGAACESHSSDSGPGRATDRSADPAALQAPPASIHNRSPEAVTVMEVPEIPGGRATSATAPASSAREYFGDIELVDHLGRTHRFYSDLIEGKVVVMNAFFSSCTSVCPAMHRVVAELGREFPERMGHDLLFLSLTVDPENDTSERLREYAQRFGADQGWLFLSGEPENVRAALAKVGFAVANPEGHSNLFIVGNEKTGLWKKVFGLGAPEAILASVQSVLDDS